MKISFTWGLASLLEKNFIHLMVQLNAQCTQRNKWWNHEWVYSYNNPGMIIIHSLINQLRGTGLTLLSKILWN